MEYASDEKRIDPTSNKRTREEKGRKETVYPDKNRPWYRIRGVTGIHRESH